MVVVVVVVLSWGVSGIRWGIVWYNWGIKPPFLSSQLVFQPDRVVKSTRPAGYNTDLGVWAEGVIPPPT